MNRVEDDRLVRGAGAFAADLDLPGQLHACFVRSPHAHARVLGLDATAARAHPGVAAVLLAADCDHLRWPPCFVRYPGRNGAAILQPRRPILAGEVVRYAGEPVALVVAAAPRSAQDAAEKVEVQYEALPAVADGASALQEDAPQLHPEVAGNLCFQYDTGDADAVAEAFGRAAHVAKVELLSQRVAANPLEPRACVVEYAAGAWTLHTPTQGVAMMRGHLAAMLGADPAQVRVVAGDVGGGFGARSTAEPEMAALAEAARRLGRPVKWSASRSESFFCDPQGRDNRIAAELALDREGRFLGLRFSFVCNMGAYLTPIGAMVHTMNPSFCAGGVYRMPAIHGFFRLALSNTVPVGPYRGAGRPDTAYMIERLVQEAAERCGFDPVELRRRNFVRREDFPYRTANGHGYDVGDFDGVLGKVLALADWQGFPRRREAARREGKLRGIGLASFIESSGGGVAAEDRVSLRAGDGAVCLQVSTQSNGQSHETVFAELLARELGIPRDLVRFEQGDPDRAPMGSGSFGSRSLMMTGSAIVAAARLLIERANVRGPALAEVAAQAQAGVAIHRAFPNGCHVAEVEIDPDTGETAIVRYSACDDFGVVVNAAAVEGQLHGGIAQGAGQVLLERCVYDPESAQQVTGSFMDYSMPRADLAPRPALADHPVPCPGNALGAKGAGEAGTTGALPALANAVLDALRPRGVERLDFPFTPERVWRALRQQEGR